MGLFNWFKSQMFGGTIVQTIGVVKGTQKGLMNVELKVHLLKDLKSNDGKAIGIEMVAKSPLSYQMMPCTLTRNSCRELKEMLSKALDASIS